MASNIPLSHELRWEVGTEVMQGKATNCVRERGGENSHFHQIAQWGWYLPGIRNSMYRKTISERVPKDEVGEVDRS
jgi:hypothetical protein